jgi:hypothetical protein
VTWRLEANKCLDENFAFSSTKIERAATRMRHEEHLRDLLWLLASCLL